MEMIVHLRLLATICGAFVVITGSWLAMREGWRWAWSANTTGLALLVLLALSPLPTKPEAVRVAVPVPEGMTLAATPFVAAWPEGFYHRPGCRWARQSVRDDNRVALPSAEAAARCKFTPCPFCVGDVAKSTQ